MGIEDPRIQECWQKAVQGAALRRELYVATDPACRDRLSVRERRVCERGVRLCGAMTEGAAAAAGQPSMNPDSNDMARGLLAIEARPIGPSTSIVPAARTALSWFIALIQRFSSRKMFGSPLEGLLPVENSRRSVGIAERTPTRARLRSWALMAKLRSCALQDIGPETVEANLALGFVADCRAYSLRIKSENLRVARARRLSDDPRKARARTEAGVKIVAQSSPRQRRALTRTPSCGTRRENGSASRNPKARTTYEGAFRLVRN